MAGLAPCFLRNEHGMEIYWRFLLTPIAAFYAYVRV